MIFNKLFKRTDGEQSEPKPSIDALADLNRQQAVDYIASLTKKDKDDFLASVELIWQGYDGMRNVKTRLQREVQRAAKADHIDDDLLEYMA